jgi:hypothetical protein
MDPQTMEVQERHHAAASGWKAAVGAYSGQDPTPLGLLDQSSTRVQMA